MKGLLLLTSFWASCISLTSLSWAAPPLPLETKLSKHFERYTQARELVIQRVARQGGALSREAWEAALALPADQRLSAAELASLKAKNVALIQKAKLAAKTSSVLDLDRVRQQDRAEEFCSAIPKGGMLHIHPWGTMSRETLSKILDDVNALVRPSKLKALLDDPSADSIVYPGQLNFLQTYGDLVQYRDLSPSDQRALQDLFFLSSGTHDFKRFLGVFTLLSQLLFSNPDRDPSPILWQGFFERARAQGVHYVEVSQNMILKPAWFAAQEKWARDAEKNYGVTARVLGAFNRMGDPEKNRKIMRLLLDSAPSEAVAGINLVADEVSHPALEAGQTIYSQWLDARASGKTQLRATIHVGELGDVRNLRDALILGAERFGHGVKLEEDPVALEYAIRQKLPIETNLVSNLRLGVVEGMSKHPFLDYLRLGLRVSLSTDDEGIFETDMNRECVTAIHETDIQYSELKRLVIHSVETAFASDPVKLKLAQDLQSALKVFEAKWKN